MKLAIRPLDMNNFAVGGVVSRPFGFGYYISASWSTQQLHGPHARNASLFRRSKCCCWSRAFYWSRKWANPREWGFDAI